MIDLNKNISAERVSDLAVIYKSQMKLYIKSKYPLMLALLIIAIPLIIGTGISNSLISEKMSYYGGSSETFAAFCLSLTSGMMAILTSMMLARSIPSEFRSRSAFLNLALPNTRTAFFLGKFLAGFTILVAEFLMAIFVITLITNICYGSINPTALMQASLITIFGLFAYSCTAFSIGSLVFSKGSELIPVLLMFVAIPGIMMMLTAQYAGATDFLCYLPSFSGDMAVVFLGSDYSFSLYSYIVTSSTSHIIPQSLPLMVASNFLWGAVFLIAGLYTFERREV